MTIQTGQSSSPQQTVAAHSLLVSIKPNLVLVSAMSSLLRVVQAALRDVARLDEDTGAPFEGQPQPVLLYSSHASGDALDMAFTFADGMYSRPMADLSSQVFGEFMERYGDFLKTLPQPGFWKDSVTGNRADAYATELDRRMDHLRIEMRRFPWVRVSFGKHSITIEGARMEIERRD